MLHFYPDVEVVDISLYIVELHNGLNTWIPKSEDNTIRCTTWKCLIASLVEENIIVGLSIQPKLAVAIFLPQKNASNSSLLKLHHCKMSLV